MRFTKKDLEIFEVLGFADRMQLIADVIRPKLTKLGELLQPQLSRLVGHEVYQHVAEHARRTVNPPVETWVAFGPDARGYKPYAHFALCVGSIGVQARVMVKQECRSRQEYGQQLASHAERFRDLKGAKEMADYTRRDEEQRPGAIADWVSFLTDTGRRLKDTQTAVLDLGINLPLSGDLSSHAIQALSRLTPFYNVSMGNGNGQPVSRF